MFTKTQALLASIGGFLQPVLLLVVRLYWGWQFFIDGKAKLQHLDRVASYFASLNIPMPRANAILTASIQCVCGLMLLAGLLTRFASLVLIGVMCVAYATAEREALFSIFSDSDKFVTATPFLFLFASTIAFVFGPGRISLDALIWKGKKA
jgi:putative oxidoreductase